MKKLLVIGDVLLDRDIFGTANRLCPDSTAPVVEVERTTIRPGGAGLAATIARSEDVEVQLLAPIANDTAGSELRFMLGEAGVGLVDWLDPGGTTEKVRLRVGGQTVARFDRLGTGGATQMPLASADLANVDAILVADYGRGTADDPKVRNLIGTAIQKHIPVVWDPHPRGHGPVSGVTLVTPNQSELELLSTSEPSKQRAKSFSSLARQCNQLRETWKIGTVAVTLGERGALVVSGDGVPLVVPTRIATPTPGDVCGAGDSFAATAAIALGAGSVVSEAIELAVNTASSFVALGGAAAVDGGTMPWQLDLDTVSQAIAEEVAPLGERYGEIASDSKFHGTLVAAGGCFDVLHAGHVATLEHARRLGDRLIVLLNSDDSVRRLKGDGRPLQNQDDRARVLRSLTCVDDVVIFDEDTPIEALRQLRPQIFVKGGDYTAADLEESEVLKAWGGSAVAVPFVADHSTTRILNRAADFVSSSGKRGQHVV